MVAFPLHMAIMSDQSFPFPAIGTVHLENRIVQHRPVRIGESVDAVARARNLRVHSKGRAFDMEVSIEADGETIWESTSRSEERRVGKECVSTCRSRCSPDHKTKKKKQQTK